MIISVPTGNITCSAPPKEKVRVRSCDTRVAVKIVAEKKDVLFSSPALQMLWGYVPESIKKLGANECYSQFYAMNRSLVLLFSFRVCHAC